MDAKAAAYDRMRATLINMVTTPQNNQWNPGKVDNSFNEIEWQVNSCSGDVVRVLQECFVIINETDAIVVEKK